MTDDFFIQFEESWFHDTNSVRGLLERLDMGEPIPIKIFKEACKKENIKFEIKYETV